MLVKFEQNRMVQITLNFKLIDIKWVFKNHFFHLSLFQNHGSLARETKSKIAVKIFLSILELKMNHLFNWVQRNSLLLHDSWETRMDFEKIYRQI